MAQGVRSLGLLVLLCFVSSSVQQSLDKSASADRANAARTGQLQELEDKLENDKSGLASANAFAQSLGHPYNPPHYTTQSPYPSPALQCSQPDEIINYRDLNNVCHVCVCVLRAYAVLEPVCGSCAYCNSPEPTTWFPPPPPTTTPAPPPPPPPPTPKCDPLPTNQPYTNPMDPCQICVCKVTEDIFGIPQSPVIECNPNPQCITPTTRPPGPPAPPNPFPVCQYHPMNVWFPHPQFACYLCKCEGSSLSEITIDCYPDPACDVTPPPPTTLAPTTPQPPPPRPHVDPLPGPSPHASCRPFTPNEPFQHPWDPCLECVCIEAAMGGLVNVQVNCFTKAECCIIPPDTGAVTQSPYIVNPTPGYYTPRPPYIPGNVGPGYIPGNVGPPAYNPGNLGPAYNPGNMGPGQIGSSSAIANALAEVNGEYGTANSLAQAEAAAQAASHAQAAVEAAHTFNQYPYYTGLDAGAAQAAAQAQAQALAQTLADTSNSNRGVPNYYPGYNTGGFQTDLPKKLIFQQPGSYYYPGGQTFPGTYGNGGQAQAISNAQTGFGTAQAQSDAFAQGDGQAQAMSDAFAQNLGYGYPRQTMGFFNPVKDLDGLWNGGPPRPDALAQAQGSALFQNGFGNQPYGYGGSSATAQAQADAEKGAAQAMANALAQGLGSQAQAGAEANAMSQPALYQAQPSYFYPPRTNTQGKMAEADAQALANSADGDATAQASAAASAIKAGDPDSQA